MENFQASTFTKVALASQCFLVLLQERKMNAAPPFPKSECANAQLTSQDNLDRWSVMGTTLKKP